MTTNDPTTISSISVLCLQTRQRELYQRLWPIPIQASSSGEYSSGAIPSSLDFLQLVIHHAITRMPHLPQEHHPPTVPTAQWIAPCTGTHPFAVALATHDAIQTGTPPPQSTQ